MESKREGGGYLLGFDGLRELFSKLRSKYRVIAPRLKDGLIAFSEVESPDELPLAYRNVESPGLYALERSEGYLTYTHPYNSPRGFLHPSELTLLKLRKGDRGLVLEADMPQGDLCIFDIRACDLSALKILDMVFLEKNPHPDPYYASLRGGLFLVAVNCTYATSTCFCTTMGTGPGVKEGYDLLITELSEGFLLEVGSDRGSEAVSEVRDRKRAEERHFREKEERLRKTESMMKVHFERKGLPERLYSRMDPRYWEHIEKRCLACTSCTQVCPTCFCFDILEKNDPELRESQRVRVWDSCFSPSFATVHRFNLRQSVHSRYRQWLMHKFAYWTDQFGTFGCVGCGRCITWCPVGIDVREEVRRVLNES